MKWIARCFWLAAWGLWLWLGFGLYGELPRELGPKAAQLPMDGRATLLGFVEESDDVALLVGEEDRNGCRKVALFEANSGASVGSLVGPQPFGGAFFAWQPLKVGVLYGHGYLDSNGKEHRGLCLLNVRHGSWRNLLPDETVVDVVVHPHMPWIAATYGHVRSLPYKAAVFNVRTGERLFERILDRPDLYGGAPLFIPDRDEVILVIAKSRELDRRIEAWKINGERKKTAEADVPLVYGASISSSGRLYFDGRLERRDADETSWKDVYDIAEGRFLSSIPPDERNMDAMRRKNAHFPVISSSGRTILRGDPAGLYEIGSGKVLWRAGPHEELAAPSDQDVFLVSEYWGDLWRQWFPRLSLESQTVRRRDTGEVLYRTTGRVPVMPFNTNAAHTLVVHGDGSVHRLPLRVDWRLFAICQSALALPLLFTWFILRWRRHRRMHFAEAAP